MTLCVTSSFSLKIGCMTQKCMTQKYRPSNRGNTQYPSMPLKECLIVFITSVTYFSQNTNIAHLLRSEQPDGSGRVAMWIRSMQTFQLFDILFCGVVHLGSQLGMTGRGIPYHHLESNTTSSPISWSDSLPRREKLSFSSYLILILPNILW